MSQFRHDCDNCTFLGEYLGHDLYHCEQGGLCPTVIARYGDDGHEYTSSLWIAQQGIIPALTEALHRAKESGLNITFASVVESDEPVIVS